MGHILDRTDENRTRKGRLKQLKRGPGVFTYDGSDFDTESEPTPLFAKNGDPVKDHSGKQKLGGEPILHKVPIETREVMGVLFPTGVPVEVKLSHLALKLRGMESFSEKEEEPEAAADKPRRGRPPKQTEPEQTES